MDKFRFVVALFALLCSSSGFSQDKLNPKVGDTIILKSYCKVIEKSLPMNAEAKKSKDPIDQNEPLWENAFLDYLEPNVKFVINAIDDKNVDLVALDYTPLSQKKLKKLVDRKPGAFERSKYYNGKIYTISRKDFDASAAKKPKEDTILNIGLLSLPFKARPQDDLSFDTEFNLNTTLSVRLGEFKKTKTQLNAQIGAGIGTVGLNVSNALGVTGDESQDVAVLSFSTGLMLQYRKVQAGLYIGVDHINNQKEYQWESNGNIWFGFGIGFNVFKISLGEDDKNSN